MRRVFAAMPTILADAAGLAGAGLLSYGAHMAWHPAGYLVGGGLLLAGAWVFSRRSAEHP